MTQVFDFTLGPALGERAALGLIVLQSDETIEHDFRRLIPSQGVSLFVSRIHSAPEVTTETLAQMEARMPEAATRLPRPIGFDAVGYGCTSGTSVIGAARVADLIRQGCATRTVTEPLSALIAACGALGVTRLALLSPYVEEVSEGLRRALGGAGIATPVFGTFNEAEETRVARIDGASILAAGRALAQNGGAQALFLSCTNLRTLDVIDRLEQETGLPVLSSNQVLAWNMLRQAGIADAIRGAGRLMLG
ncbi:maleate cis-trans isomerase family protein [Tropicibacter oceani]|uniref:Aspartate/glutamate racemase family protein n=1 Tax=Tropicibacter oceani TaxID=3058420 RepID=A0ABY8QGB9_9RHOB|nr:aspartate/glutamate racemase family protein [Tropicibacter oceani]WGW03048.1 aspartate/glutamate racemase family protein [Tropicibacter oceani]